MEAKRWQDILLTRPSSLPFPVVYETNEDLMWSKNQKGRLCVHFNGLTGLTFEVYCDNRQLHWFKRFLEDQQTKRQSKNQHSSGLFTLRNGRLAWQEGEGKGEPWNLNHLTLYSPNQFGTSELGQYVDRLLAKEIVAIAETYKAGSIVLPKLGDIREIIQSEIQALAEAKCPGSVEIQQKYAKQYRVNVHSWSYGRLIQSIQIK